MAVKMRKREREIERECKQVMHNESRNKTKEKNAFFLLIFIATHSVGEEMFFHFLLLNVLRKLSHRNDVNKKFQS